MSYPTYPSIDKTGTPVKSLTDSKLAALAPVMPSFVPDGLVVQAIMFDSSADANVNDTKVQIYFAKSAVEPGQTIMDVLGAGGGSLIEAATSSQDAASVQKELGSRATIIKVGPYDAAYVHSDILPGGFRVHSLFWSDGQRDYSLTIRGSGDEVVKVAQSIYCG